MSRIERDEEREERILMEVIVDAYDSEEQAMGWYYYLAEGIEFPFRAKCVEERRNSPLKLGEEIVVDDMASGDDCLREMFVEVAWQDRRLTIPLAQIEAIDSDESIIEAVEDWRYWVKRGYQLV